MAVYATNNQGDWGDLIATLSPTGDLTEGGEATCENTTYVEFDAPQGGTSWVRAIVDLNDCAGPTWESDDCIPRPRLRCERRNWRHRHLQCELMKSHPKTVFAVVSSLVLALPAHA